VTLTDLSGHTITINTLSAAQLTEFRDLGRALCDRQINGTPSMYAGGTISTAAQRPTTSTASLLGNAPIRNTSSSSNAPITLKDALGTEYVRHLARRFGSRANQNEGKIGSAELRNEALRTLGTSLGAHKTITQKDGTKIVMSDCLDRIFGHCKLTDKYSVDADVKNVKALTGKEGYKFVAFDISVTNSNRPSVSETLWMTKQSDDTISDVRVVPKGTDADAIAQRRQLKLDMLKAAAHVHAYPSALASTITIQPW
jgi:hypothetical protein